MNVPDASKLMSQNNSLQFSDFIQARVYIFLISYLFYFTKDGDWGIALTWIPNSCFNQLGYLKHKVYAN